MPRLTPCLWFDHQAEEAAQFYCSVFPHSKITNVGRYTEAGPGKPGSAMIVAFELDGQPFTALNGGPLFKFSEAVSLQVDCNDQREVDYYWERLTADGGQESMCGWLKDKFGFSWQIVPDAIPRLLGQSDPARAKRVMEKLFTMKKIDIAALEKAAAGWTNPA